MKNEQLTNEKKRQISKLEGQRKEYRKKPNRGYHKRKENKENERQALMRDIRKEISPKLKKATSLTSKRLLKSKAGLFLKGLLVDIS